MNVVSVKDKTGHFFFFSFLFSSHLHYYRHWSSCLLNQLLYSRFGISMSDIVCFIMWITVLQWCLLWSTRKPMKAFNESLQAGLPCQKNTIDNMVWFINISFKWDAYSVILSSLAVQLVWAIQYADCIYAEVRSPQRVYSIWYKTAFGYEVPVVELRGMCSMPSLSIVPNLF